MIRNLPNLGIASDFLKSKFATLLHNQIPRDQNMEEICFNMRQQIAIRSIGFSGLVTDHIPTSHPVKRSSSDISHFTLYGGLV